ncbi:L,D-transpeptidase [Spirillospora sp. NPDC052242]
MSEEPSRVPLGLAAGAAAAALLLTGCGGGGKAAAGAAGAAPAGDLPQATTYTTLDGLPRDSAPPADGPTTVVHPEKTVPVSAEPGGPALAELPATQLKGPTWVPVVESRPGWRRVLLPSRPNRVTGWIPDKGLRAARSTHVIKVDLSDREMTLAESGRDKGTWTVAVGAPKTPTPTGRTFLLASLAPPEPTYSPLILPVGAHSATLDTFGGGPGTVAFHGWRDASVFGEAVTHGCVRVPADALDRLSRVPLGSVVDIRA